MLPKADSSSFVLFSLLFVLTLTDPPRTGKYIQVVFALRTLPWARLGSGGNRDYSCNQSGRSGGKARWIDQGLW